MEVVIEWCVRDIERRDDGGCVVVARGAKGYKTRYVFLCDVIRLGVENVFLGGRRGGGAAFFCARVQKEEGLCRLSVFWLAGHG